MKKLTITKFKKLAVSDIYWNIKYYNKTQFNILDLIISDDIKDKRTYRKLKFLPTRNVQYYKLKENIPKKKYYEFDDKYYRDWGIINDFYKNKYKINKHDIIFIYGMISFDNGKNWIDGNLEVCGKKYVSYKCIDGSDGLDIYYNE